MTSHEVTSVLRSSSCVKVTHRETEGTNLEQNVVGGKEEVEGTFDEIVFACDADAAVKLLGKGASWLEKKALGNVKVSVTADSFRRLQVEHRLTFTLRIIVPIRRFNYPLRRRVHEQVLHDELFSRSTI